MESNFKIDGNALEIECIRQVDLMEHWSYVAANARKEHDSAKLALERATMMTDQLVRNDPREFGILKPSEAAIKRVVDQHPNVRTRARNLVEAKAAVVDADAAMNCLEHRKRMLEQLVKLHGAGYFSEINVEDVPPRYNNNTSDNSRPLRNPKS